MKKINQAWYTKEDHLPLPHMKFLKIKKRKIGSVTKTLLNRLLYLDLFLLHVIRRGSNLVNVVSLRIYDEKSHLGGEILEGFQSSYRRLARNQG